MRNMEQMQNFIKDLKSQTHMLLDASAGGVIRQMTEPQVKDLIEKMFMNEYHSKSERSVKLETSGTPKGMLTVDTHVALLAQIELLNKQLAKDWLNKAKVIQVQSLKFDLYGGGRENEICSLEGISEEAQIEKF